MNYYLNFWEIIHSLNDYALGTVIESEDKTRYKLEVNEVGARKFTRIKGTRLRFMTYNNIGKKFRLVNEKELDLIEKLNFNENNWSNEGKQLINTVNKLVDEVNKLNMKESMKI